MKYPSCIAAKLAIMHTGIEEYLISRTVNVSGNRNRTAPVTLFARMAKPLCYDYRLTDKKIPFLTFYAQFCHFGRSPDGSGYSWFRCRFIAFGNAGAPLLSLAHLLAMYLIQAKF